MSPILFLAWILPRNGNFLSVFGVRGWVGIELGSIGDEELASHIREAWRLVAPKKLKAS